ncbi:hypothetical protein GCM10009733_032870 [Nonomuraea maheshkhaliensis]|uniref:DUF5753 domain-containing protein n=1 Tax=Nonomuraea maheshkhaliensis TaxID=419590 RepID=A0ABN2F6T4_9ACTN
MISGFEILRAGKCRQHDAQTLYVPPLQESFRGLLGDPCVIGIQQKPVKDLDHLRLLRGLREASSSGHSH